MISLHLEHFNGKGRNFKCTGKNRSEKTKENSIQKSSFLSSWANSAALEKALSPLWSWLSCLSSHLNRVTHLAYLLLLIIEGKWDETMPSNSDLGSRERRMIFLVYSVFYSILKIQINMFYKSRVIPHCFIICCISIIMTVFLESFLSSCIVFYYVAIVQFI